MATRSLELSYDCDDVLLDTVPLVVKHYNETYDANVDIAQYYNSEAEHWGVSDFKIVDSRIKKFLKEFGPTELIIPYPEAVVAVNALARKGHKQHIITARSDFMIPVTVAMVETFMPDCFESIVHTNGYDENPRSKGSVCAELGVDAHTDDHIEHCNSAIDHGVPEALLLTRKWNQDEILRPGITRCDDWQSIVKRIIKLAKFQPKI